jgi:hypothetical protein
LNAELRQVRRDRGELLGPDVRFETITRNPFRSCAARTACRT